MQVAPVAFKPLLKVTADIAGPAGAVAGGEMAGTIPVALALENTSHVTAQLPFLCVTDLGFNIHPVAQGQMEKISAEGRRLVRFHLEPGASLRSGEKLTICTLTISWRGRDPPFVSFDLGVGHALDALRDLRMFCVTGAANFPSERSHLTLTCEAVGTAVAAAGDSRSGQVPPRAAREA